jgi:D-alanyl-D-alanine carboxypeptidase/D-alanyl-D-alanine-endopeptidase (penicillin-binding protein 4)
MTFPVHRTWTTALMLFACALAFGLAPSADARPKARAKARAAAVKSARAPAAVRPAAATAIARAPKAETGAEAEDDAAESAAPAAPVTRTTDLAADLQAILRGASGKSSPYVALIVDAASGKAVLEHDPAKVVYPASVAKLFTTAAAVRTLDLDRKPTTELRLVGKGADAELHVVAVGDPTMTHGDWAKLAAAVQQRGIQKVRRLVIDASVFDDRLPKGFDEKQTDAAYRAPVGGAMVDASTLAVAVRPGAVGAPPIVVVTPDAGGAVTVINQAQTQAGKGSTLAIVTRPAGRGTEVLVTGVLSVKAKAVGSGRRRVSDASFFAGWVFKKLLEKQGISVGDPVFAKAGAGEVVARHQNRDWRAIVAVTNKQSHNGYAETLFKQVGLALNGAPATNEKAADAVRKSLDGLDIHWEGVRIANGSGLYHADQVTARAVVDLLRAMARDPKGGEFRNSLAVGGVDGTLRGRLKGPDTQGKVFAKTGTLDDVSGLAGYAQNGDKAYVFAFFFNGLKTGPGPLRALQDRLLRRLLAPG